MTIISAPTDSSIPHIPPPETLLSSHPASQLFDLTITRCTVNAVTIEFQARDSAFADSGDLRAALGCVIDCAARLAARPAIGICSLLEQELHFRAPCTATSFYVTAQIDSSSSRYALYQSAVYALGEHKPSLIADSQGTLLKQTQLTSQ
ncbi:hypothetical protein [Marinimicrobium sp. ABcell2]|uniref:hypothetical protein n=1 Tax=Marinimicrobium sp. ABcell2 TaxID=3069751 RepID=UPI0027B52F21|nr:hypothetical protein [Marinimicrobium sp. ABcell2]MDQ2076770.1 hypothetical protein [Marinimicrobium sp. ABcell2]